MAAGITCEAEVLNGFGDSAVPLGIAHAHFPPEVCGYFANCFCPPPPPKPKEKRRCRLNEETAARLRAQLQAAMNGEHPKKLFDKYDKDKSSTLSAPELRRLLRFELRITAAQLSDDDIRSLVTALDDDGTGSVSIDELSDFIERGTATFFSGPVSEEKDAAGAGQDSTGPMYAPEGEAKFGSYLYAPDRAADVPSGIGPTELAQTWGSTGSLGGDGLVLTAPQSPWHSCHAEVSDGAVPLGTIHTHLSPEVFGYLAATLSGMGYGTPPAGPPAARVRKKQPRGRALGEDVAKRLQSQLKFAMGATHPQKLFRRFDKDRSGTLNAEELKRLIRVELRVPPERLGDADIGALVLALDDDGGGDLSIDELVDFVERGTATFYSGPVVQDTDEHPDGSELDGKPPQDPGASVNLDAFSRKRAKRRHGAHRQSLNEDGFPIIPGGNDEGEMDWSRPVLYTMSRGLVKSRAVANARRTVLREKHAGNPVFSATWPFADTANNLSQNNMSHSQSASSMRSGCVACGDTAPAASTRGTGEDDDASVWDKSTQTVLSAGYKPRRWKPHRQPRNLPPLALIGEGNKLHNVSPRNPRQQRLPHQQPVVPLQHEQEQEQQQEQQQQQQQPQQNWGEQQQHQQQQASDQSDAGGWGASEASGDGGNKRKWEPDEKSILGKYPGTIKSFSAKTGFGFIECEDLKKQGYANDVFLHHSQVGEFAVGSQIMFTAFLSGKGLPQAKDLSAVP